jgi:hypothetical protein
LAETIHENGGKAVVSFAISWRILRRRYKN